MSNLLNIQVRSQSGLPYSLTDFQTSLGNTERSLTEAMASVPVKAVGVNTLPSHPGGVASYIMGSAPAGNLSDLANHLAIFYPRLNLWVFIPPTEARQLRLAAPRDQVITWNNANTAWETGNSDKLVLGSVNFSNPYDVSLPGDRFIFYRPEDFAFRAIPLAGTGLDFNPGLDTNLSGEDDTAPFVAEKTIGQVRLRGITIGATPARGGGLAQTSGAITLPNSLFVSGATYSPGETIYIRILKSTAADTTPSLFSTGLVDATSVTTEALGGITYNAAYAQIGRLVYNNATANTRVIELDFGTGTTIA